ncbi:MAG: aminopeptidase [Candidatus Alcyoniella australis]|nr:aminopeptidase [Candidatus Alcyoniella australis]
MLDPRVTELAEILVNYSTKVKKGDTVLIHGVGLETLPIVKQLHKLALLRGAKLVKYEFIVPDIELDFYNLAKPSQAAYQRPHELEFMKSVDCFIGVRSPENSMVFANAEVKNMQAAQKATHAILDERVRNSRWVVTRFPTQGAAQDAKMSLEQFTEFFFRATCIDYPALRKHQQQLVRIMSRTDQVQIKSADTDLRFSIKGIGAVNCCGERNVPDGEVFSAPVRDSVEGYLTYNCPSIYQGREFNNVRLEFSKGKIVKAEAGALSAELNKVFDTDPGARYIGEFAIGTNHAITTPMRNILFDEKIGGSIHFTPGMAYDETDNGNRSAVHWDLVKVLKPEYGGGEIWFDNKLIQRNGEFVHSKLLALNPPKAAKAKGRRKKN